MRFAMIGSRGHWNYVFQSIRQLPEIDLCAISSGCADSPDALLKKSEEHQYHPEVWSDWKEMLDQVKPDLVCVDGPFALHAEMAREALLRGISVFAEKPVALTFHDLNRLHQAQRHSNGKLFCMTGMRYEAPFYRAHQLLEEGIIGKIKLIQAQKSYKLGVRPEFYKTRKEYGGTIPWVGSHAIDMIRWFTGSEYHSVYALQNAEDNSGNGDMEISAQCQFLMKNQVLASVSIDYLRPEGAPTHNDDRIRIAGTEGVLEIRGGQLYLTGGEGEKQLALPEPDRFLFTDIALDLLGRRNAILNTDDAVAVTRACLLARESADRKKPMKF